MKNVFKTALKINGEYLDAELVELGDRGLLLRLETGEWVEMSIPTFEMWSRHPELNLSMRAKPFCEGAKVLCQ